MTTTTVPQDALRPATLDEVVGQKPVVDALRVVLDGAQARGEMPGHLLLIGPAGTGKTTLALIVASAVGGRLVSLIGPNLRKVGDVLDMLLAARARDIIFIDEIHRMYRPVQEYLFPVMEDGVLADDGPRIKLPPMMFIGATTDPDRLLTPMLDRFTTVLRLEPYNTEDLATIASRGAAKLGCTLMLDAALAIGEAAEGIPRVALRLVRAARDYAYSEVNVSAGKTTVGKPLGAVRVEDGIALTLPQAPTDTRLTIGAAAVNAVLSSPAYVWRQEGRSASDR